MLCTNPVLIKKAIETKAVNSLLLKVNQIGTVTEAIEVSQLLPGMPLVGGAFTSVAVNSHLQTKKDYVH